MEYIICTHCGEKNNSGTRYCANCHKSLTGTVQASDGPGAKNSWRKNFLRGEDITIPEWLVILVAFCIPGVNLVVLVLLAWIKTKKSLQNFARAVLILMGVFLIWMVVSRLIV